MPSPRPGPLQCPVEPHVDPLPPFSIAVFMFLSLTLSHTMSDAADPSGVRLRAAKDSSSHPQSNGTAKMPPPKSLVEDRFFWAYTEEPHRSRRQAIIKAHPEVCD